MTCGAGCSRPRPGTAAAPVTRSTASAGCCAAASITCPPRRGPGWRPGWSRAIPDGEVTHRLDHRPAGHGPLPARPTPPRPAPQAAELIDGAAHVPDPRTGPPRTHPARLARRAGRALRPSRRVERPDREPQPENQEHQADRPRIPQLRPLPAAVVAQPRPHPRRSLTDANQNPRSQVRCVEPDYGRDDRQNPAGRHRVPIPQRRRNAHLRRHVGRPHRTQHPPPGLGPRHLERTAALVSRRRLRQPPGRGRTRPRPRSLRRADLGALGRTQTVATTPTTSSHLNQNIPPGS